MMINAKENAKEVKSETYSRPFINLQCRSYCFISIYKFKLELKDFK